MRCHNPPQKYHRKPFSHIYHRDKLPCKCRVQEESGFTAAQAGSSAGIIYSWLGGRALLESHQWFFIFFLSPSCLKQVKAGPLHLLPSLHCSLRAPPGRLVFHHYNYLFCCWHMHTHFSITVRVRQHKGTYCSDSATFQFHTCTCGLCSTTYSASCEGEQTPTETEQTWLATLFVDLTNRPSSAATSYYFSYCWMCQFQLI